ncbi:zinc finger protein Xfin-like isoform X2 [Watersipora subatra]|uniref:zinc finger protein Xfin-like isoform X2 n=1 Tax=Watersipora subatra TaxID=2589382 RepID=UPI00355C6481
MTATSARSIEGHPLASNGPFSMPIKRSPYPIYNRKRDRVRPRKQESPQPLVKLEKSSPTESFSNESLVPTSPTIDEREGSDPSLHKRPRVIPPGAASSPTLPHGAALFSPEQSSSDISHSRRPLVLPRVYSCPRCSKSFIKLSHLHRHMNKKKPCEVKDNSITVSDVKETEDIASVPSEVTFTCGLCSEQYTCYEQIINHHSEKHPAYYPGYCRFCGKFQDRKNKLLIHLVKHDHTQIVDEVAQEVKRIRQIKIDKQPPASQLSLPTNSSVYGINPGPTLVSSQQTSLASAPLPGAELTCPCCSAKFPDRDELVCHFQDFHVAVGSHVSESDVLESLEEDQSSGLRCFICMLPSASQQELEQHLDLHKVWSEKAEPEMVNGSPHSEGPSKMDENRNLTKPINKDIASEEPQSNNNNNSDHVMDLSLNTKKLERSPLISVSSADSNGSPEETVALDYPCWLCTDQHCDLESWRDHISSAHKIHLVFRCVLEECRAEFPSSAELLEHSSQHSQKSFICRGCNDHVASRSLLIAHSESHSHPRSLPSMCSYCQSLIQDNIELHRLECSQQLVDCPECNEKVKRLALMKHMITHSSKNGTTYRCEHCESSFPLRDRLTQHIKNVHGPRKFVCTDCGAAFKRNDKLQRHCQSRHSDLKPYLCPIVSCGRAFKRIDGLRAHVKSSHVTEALAHQANQHYGCTVCGKLVSGQEKLVDHLMSHVKASPPSVMSSSMSGELFGSGEAVGESKGVVPPVVPQFECPHCSFKVPNETLFYAHLVQHSQMAFRSPAMPFTPASFFFPLSQNTLAPSADPE